MTHLLPDTIERTYFKIGEVADALGISQVTLRYYEEFFELNLHRNRKGDRKITVNEIGDLAIICRLAEHLRLESAKQVFYMGRAQEVLQLLEEKELGGVPMKVL